jgi:hypothetical protein
MTLLPGQRLVNGVSNFIFGTNLGNQVSPNGVLVTPAIQAKVKACGMQIMRCFANFNKDNSYVDEQVAAAQACGCQILFVLSLLTANQTANQNLITYLGSKCLMYEYGNEPNGSAKGFMSGSGYYNGVTNGTGIYTGWGTGVPALRAVAQAGTAFMGPTITYRAGALDGQFITDWITLCNNSGVPAQIPDAVSFHHYPCTAFPNQANAPDGTIFASDFTIVDNAVRGVLGHSLPIAITEWNVSGGTPPQSYALDPTFATPWVHHAMDTFVSSGYAMACQFEAGTGEGAGGLDLIQATVAGFPPGPDYQPIFDKYLQYLGGAGHLGRFMAHA